MERGADPGVASRGAQPVHICARSHRMLSRSQQPRGHSSKRAGRRGRGTGREAGGADRRHGAARRYPAPHLAAQRHVSLPSPRQTAPPSWCGPAERPAGSGGRTGVGDGAELLRRALRILRVLVRVPPQRQPPVRLLHLPTTVSAARQPPGTEHPQRRRDGVGCLSAGQQVRTWRVEASVGTPRVL